ncbi:hypothetical protein [Amycolatopsis thermoflava]|uniref:hypothetical protein n=1 Tax=Amycolatopsis thermoflava TaxID=84480 RepID=UPI00048813C6|nr:hypothetical protein [Amycolatopsis thermoflava]
MTAQDVAQVVAELLAEPVPAPSMVSMYPPPMWPAHVEMQATTPRDVAAWARQHHTNLVVHQGDVCTWVDANFTTHSVPVRIRARARYADVFQKLSARGITFDGDAVEVNPEVFGWGCDSCPNKTKCVVEGCQR